MAKEKKVPAAEPRKVTFRPLEERAALVKQVDAERESLGMVEACKKAGVAVGTYYSWKAAASPKAKKKSKAAILPTTTLDLNSIQIPEENSDITVVVIRGKPKAIGKALGGGSAFLFGGN